jgi:hypothetical protein
MVLRKPGNVEVKLLDGMGLLHDVRKNSLVWLGRVPSRHEMEYSELHLLLFYWLSGESLNNPRWFHHR